MPAARTGWPPLPDESRSIALSNPLRGQAAADWSVGGPVQFRLFGLLASHTTNTRWKDTPFPAHASAAARDTSMSLPAVGVSRSHISAALLTWMT